MKRKILQIHEAEYAPVADLVTYRVLPGRTVEYIDPFLFMNHHGPQVYAPDNTGLPFGPHPHRGIETVTFVIEGDISHLDNGGHHSIIHAGGVQWMKAGRGIIHSEVSSQDFTRDGGRLEILQLWLNMPASQKMSEPYYKGLEEKDIPTVEPAPGVKSLLIAGDENNHKAAFESSAEAALRLIKMQKNSSFRISIQESRNIFFYIVQGLISVNGTECRAMQLVEFERNGEELQIVAKTVATLVLGWAEPLNEPVVFGGPFVMNTEEQIRQSYADYHEGKFIFGKNN